MPTTYASAAPARSRLALAPADVLAHLARFELGLADLLTDSNPKLAKGGTLARSVILHHLPARALAAACDPATEAATAPRGHLPALAALAWRQGVARHAAMHDGCPWATAGCRAGCLTFSGHGGLSPAVAAARGRRTLAYLADPATYGRAVLFALARELHRTPAGLPLAARLRGTDDQPWHRITFPVTLADVAHLAARYGVSAFAGDRQTVAGALALHRHDGSLHLYDYSKAPLSGPLGLLAQQRAGFDVTASLAADRATAVADAVDAVGAGFRLAVPVALAKGAPLPQSLTLTPYGGAPVTLPAVDGDGSDHRWSEPGAVAVILRTKKSRGADAAVAARFSLAPVAELQRLADGTARLGW